MPYNLKKNLKKYSGVDNDNFIEKNLMSENKEKNFILPGYEVLLEKGRKYPFIYNPNSVIVKPKNALPEELQNANKKYVEALKKENKKLFSQYFTIVKKGKFSDKFTDPLNNSFDREHAKEREIKEKTIINEDIIVIKKLVKEMDEEIKKRKVSNSIKLISKIDLFHKFKRALILNASYIKHLNVRLDEIINEYKISPYSFSCHKTEELIFAIRKKNYIDAIQIIENYKYIVFDFDYFHLTPLHWAAKCNFYQIIPRLIGYGAQVNFKNFLGETALHIALKRNYFESSFFLLLYLSSPFLKDNNGKTPLDYAKDYQLKFAIQKCQLIHFKNILFSKISQIYDNIQKEFINFILGEFNNKLEHDALNFFREKGEEFSLKI